jgi:hypothetical protein
MQTRLKGYKLLGIFFPVFFWKPVGCSIRVFSTLQIELVQRLEGQVFEKKFASERERQREREREKERGKRERE